MPPLILGNGAPSGSSAARWAGPPRRAAPYCRRERPATTAPPDTCRQTFGVAGEEISLALFGLRSANLSSGTLTSSNALLLAAFTSEGGRSDLLKPQDGSPRSRFRRPLRRPKRSANTGSGRILSPHSLVRIRCAP